jgi:hypothetical protein
MQAFLWRHLVPAQDFQALAYSPADEPAPRRGSRLRPPSNPTPASTNAAAATDSKSKFTPQQINARLRQLRLLHDEGLLTDEFHQRKVAECEAAL